MADQADKSRIILSPTTYERHSAAFNYVAQVVVTRDPRKGIQRFPGVAPGAWGMLASGATLTAASGTTLGGGTVRLCSSTGQLYNPDQPITVANAGVEITASEGDTIVALEWTAGVWSTCGCGASEPTCGESCGVCGAVDFMLPGLVDGTHPVGHAARVAIWTDPEFMVAAPPSAGVANAGFNYVEYDEDGNPVDTGNPVLYFYAVRCGEGGPWLDVYFNATEISSGSGEWAQTTDVVKSGYFAREATSFDSSIPDTAPMSIASCDDGTITLAYEFLYWTIYAPPPIPLTGTVTLPMSPGPGPAARMCCEPCWMTKTDKKLTIFAGEHTLAFDGERWVLTRWVLSCTAGLIELATIEGDGAVTGSGAGIEWTLDEDNSTCSPLHLVFTSVSGTAYVDEP